MNTCIPSKELISNYLNCYIGYSKDKEIRWKASSGGIASSVLIFCLKKGLIDGAIVTRMSKENPLKPEVFIARSKDEILSASGSKYCPVPVIQMINVIKELSHKEGKYAVVGLPCHINAIRRAESLNKAKDRILLYIGLFCSHTVKFSGTDILLKRLNVREEDIIEFNYRGKGWPGNLSISLKNGRIISYPFLDYWGALFTPFFFTPRQCMFCSDALNELADISLGDAWLPELKKKETIGISIIISRTLLGEEILRKLRGDIQISYISASNVVQSQAGALFFKKRSLEMRKYIMFRNKSLKELFSVIKSSPLIFTCVIFQLLGIRLSENEIFQDLLIFIPNQLLKIYSLIVGGFHYLAWRKNFN